MLTTVFGCSVQGERKRYLQFVAICMQMRPVVVKRKIAKLCEGLTKDERKPLTGEIDSVSFVIIALFVNVPQHATQKHAFHICFIVSLSRMKLTMLRVCKSRQFQTRMMKILF